MRTITVSVSMGLVGCKRSEDIEVEDDATEDDIDAQAREVMFSLIDWTWEEKTAKGAK